jgi:hypothetical protein
MRFTDVAVRRPAWNGEIFPGIKNKPPSPVTVSRPPSDWQVDQYEQFTLSLPAAGHPSRPDRQQRLSLLTFPFLPWPGTVPGTGVPQTDTINVSKEVVEHVVSEYRRD